jgi:hypothetical protein
MSPEGHAHACSVDPDQPVADPIPDTLNDAMRAEIDAAIQRANGVWSNTTFTLEPGSLDTVVAGQALADDRAEIETLRQARQRQRATSVDYQLVDASIDSPGHATAHTRETRSIEILNLANLQVIQSNPPRTYSDTYTLDWIDGGWTVTGNDVR